MDDATRTWLGKARKTSTGEPIVLPGPCRVLRTAEARKLYRVEEEVHDLISEAAREWSKIVDVTEAEFWTRALPQILYDLLEGYETGCSLAAAQAFIRDFDEGRAR